MNSGFPNLRFLGFEGEWEEKKLGNVCDINPKNESLPNTFIYIDLESVVDGSLQKENTVLKEEAPSRAQRILIKNDILFQMVRPYQKNNLFFDKDGDFVASTGYAQIRTKENSQFIFQYLHNQNFVDKVIERCTGTSYPAINSSDLGKIQIAIPKLEEQKKIGDFLNLISQRILSQKKIIEGLITQKNFIVKKLFKQNLSDLNTILLSDFLKIPNKIKPNIIDKEKLLTVKLHLKGVHKNENSDSLSLGATNYFIRKKGQFIYGKQNLFNGAFAIIPDKYDGFLSSADVPALDINEDIVNAKYLFYFFSRESFYKKLEDIASGSGSKRIHENTLLNLKITIPSLAIQNKVAIFLSKLDEKINLENELLTQYENQKKYLLQNLFV
ncbi:restriction endonuclease subunit S [Chryseobacterium mucoviscidosis]|uniref:restriction endonuclease subunit S n=1 Tax=Chryseobacterium mucoviscidosis TaxID=1945581 RepID=UPI000B3F8703|nr:restriction endonuclease subunit S [Chryseobacterium mucoviscidosis]